MLESLPLRISVLVICFLWTLPTSGLFVSSFRNPQLITQTGWWTALLHPFEPTSGRCRTTSRSSGRTAWARPS